MSNNIGRQVNLLVLTRLKSCLHSQMHSRRFPPPWSAKVTPNCFIVRDANGQALTYIYYESEPGRRVLPNSLFKA